MDIIVENIRGFSGRRRIPIRPISVLTGENSTGKTSFLAMVSSLFDSEGYPSSPNFNKEPYRLGGYDTIATYKGGRYGRADYFSLGYQSREDDISVESKYVKGEGKISLKNIVVKTENKILSVDMAEEEEGKVIVRIKSEGRSFEEVVEMEEGIVGKGMAGQEIFFALSLASSDELKEVIGGDEGVEELFRITNYIVPGESVSLAPIRTKPKRTYGQVVDKYDPSGKHIPSTLSKIFRNKDRSEERKRVFDSIRRFGKMSGLFEDVRIKKLGDKLTDPFQLQVKGEGRWANIVDVGYGVSQVLPVIAQSTMTSDEAALLLQQPEVHLHPRAQAALGSFFAEIMSNSNQYLAVETHSDYILDRIRREINEGTISSSDVVVLFFEKDGVESRVHPLKLDSKGNVLDPPDSYRSFFLEEEVNMLKKGVS